MGDISILSDEEIVEKVRSGDRDLYAVIIERYASKLLRYASNMIREKDLTAHIVQDAFIKGYVNLNGFDSKKKFSSWIYRIVHNEAMNVLKKTKREKPIPEGFDFESEEDIEKSFEQKETSVRVEKCLGVLPRIYSAPLALFYFEDKSYQEIGDILRIPIGTVGTRISRAKKLMKNICKIK